MSSENPKTSAELERIIAEQAQEIESLKTIQGNLMQGQAEMVQRVRRFITSFPFGLIVVGKGQAIDAVNNLAESYFQSASAELKGKPIATIFPEIKTLEATGQALRAMGRRSSGEMFATEIFVNELGFGGDERLFVSVQDIEERHRLEQLRKDLMGMVSHDLRAPLTSIRVVLDMLREGIYGELSGRGGEVIVGAIESTQYLSSMVTSLLDAEKAESGGIELVVQETSIDAIVSKAVSTIEVPNDKLSVLIETDCTKDALKADRDRVAQVLINLITNAIKYSPDGGTVLVRGYIEGLAAKFEVIDSGPGIPKEMQPLVFERYRQLEQPQGVKRKGFGLGLAICKALVEQHGGKIWVESQPGQGSEFIFTIPLIRE